MKKRIVQFSAGFNTGDAISNEILHLQKNFSDKGFQTEIYSENIGPQLKRKVKPFRSYSHKKEDILIYHHSIHSKISEKISEFDSSKVLIYHNVTPYQFFLPYDLKLSHYLKKGREELKDLKNLFEYSFADSKYNESELVSLGYKNTSVLPIYYNFEKLLKKEKISSKKKNILFVGRIAPNKKQDDLIRIAKILSYQDEFDFELQLVGYCSFELNEYKKDLEKLIRLFGLEDKVKFSGLIDDDKLCEYYSNADLFLCMSEHEGFLVPVIESMFYQVPIIAFNAGAVPDTLNGSGILIEEKDLEKIAKLILYLFQNQEFKNEIVLYQNKKLQEFRQNQNLIDFNQKLTNLL